MFDTVEPASRRGTSRHPEAARSRGAAEHFLELGFEDMAGCIEAGSRDVDPSTPRYW